MIFFGRLILWGVLFIVTVSQFLLYLPDLSCAGISGLSVCTPQFSFVLVETSNIAHEFITSVREFLKLLSYLTIDMGWSSKLNSLEVYNDENLIDTFHSDNMYQVNHFGYCKLSRHEKTYCTSSFDVGMDCFSILIRDVGYQLAEISSRNNNNTQLLGDALMVAYKVTLKSIRRLLKTDRNILNAVSEISDTNSDLTPKKVNQQNYSSYKHAANFFYSLLLFNIIMVYYRVVEMSMSSLCVIVEIVFGIALFIKRKHETIPLIVKITASLLLLLSSLSFSAEISYIMLLKMLEPDSKDIAATGWEMMQVKIGSGFIFSSIRYGLQWIYLAMAFLVAGHYSDEKKKKVSKKDPKTDTTKWADSAKF